MIHLFLSAGWSQDNLRNSQWLRVELANDVVFQTDQNYTNGIKLEYITENDISLLAPLHFLHRPESVTFSALMLRQDIFTPQKMNSGVYHPMDRPFASYLLLGSRKTTLDYGKKLVYTSSFAVGVLGKYAGGELVQNGVHDALPGSAHVVGWENQVKSDLALNYGLEVEKGLLNHELVGVSGHLQGMVGLPYTYAGTGLTLRFGDYLDYFSNMNLYERTGWRMHMYTSVDANVILYNATIQGGLFNPYEQSNRLALNNFVYKLKSGLNISYKSYNFEIGMQQVSPEFKNSTMHRWGYLCFTFQL
jgi:hypothetical protein